MYFLFTYFKILMYMNMIVCFMSFMINSNNLIQLLMIFEMILLNMILMFSFLSYMYNTFFGILMSMLMMMMAATETSMSLMLMMNLYKMKGSISYKNLNLLK